MDSGVLSFFSALSTGFGRSSSAATAPLPSRHRQASSALGEKSPSGSTFIFYKHRLRLITTMSHGAGSLCRCEPKPSSLFCISLFMLVLLPADTIFMTKTTSKALYPYLFMINRLTQRQLQIETKPDSPLPCRPTRHNDIQHHALHLPVWRPL